MEAGSVGLGWVGGGGLRLTSGGGVGGGGLRLGLGRLVGVEATVGVVIVS